MLKPFRKLLLSLLALTLGATSLFLASPEGEATEDRGLECTYNIAIALNPDERCVVYVDDIDVAIADTGLSLATFGRVLGGWELECAHFSSTQTLCERLRLVPQATPTPTPTPVATEQGDVFVDAAGNTCRNLRDVNTGEIVNIVCSSPGVAPAAPVPQFTG